jgi:hypothetical protein
MRLAPARLHLSSGRLRLSSRLLRMALLSAILGGGLGYGPGDMKSYQSIARTAP